MITFKATLNKLQAEFDSYKKTHEATLVELADAKSKLEKLGNVEELVGISDKLASVTTERDQLKTDLESVKGEVITLKQTQADFEKAVTEKSLSIVAAQGIPQVALTVEEPSPKGVVKLHNGFTMRSV